MARIDINHVRHAYGQNPKSDADYAALTDALATQPDAGARAISGLMREARPLAFPAQNVSMISPERNAT